MKTSRSEIALMAAAIAALLFATSCERSTENLIQNPGFETGSGEAPEGWGVTIPATSSSHELTTDATESRSGRQSYRMSRMWTYPRRPTVLKTRVPVSIDPGKKYLLGFWYKTRDIHEYPVSLAVQFIVRGDDVPAVTYEKRMPNAQDWQQYFVLLDHIPARGTELELAFHYRPNSKGIIVSIHLGGIFREGVHR